MSTAPPHVMADPMRTGNRDALAARLLRIERGSLITARYWYVANKRAGLVYRWDTYAVRVRDSTFHELMRHT